MGGEWSASRQIGFIPNIKLWRYLYALRLCKTHERENFSYQQSDKRLSVHGSASKTHPTLLAPNINNLLGRGVQPTALGLYVARI
jgi:hypothetical protein